MDDTKPPAYRKEYELTASELEDMIKLQEVERTAIETNSSYEARKHRRTNHAWQMLGQRMGFKWDTVKPVPGKSQRFFTAEPILERL